MGNGYLYYYPEPDAGIEALDLGGPFSSLEDRGTMIRVTREGIESADTAAALRTLDVYAQSARPFGLSLDHAKTWAGFCTRIRLRGETTIPTSGNAFAAYSASGALATGDYVVVESGYPEWKSEIAKVAAVSGSTITLASPGLRRSYRETPILIRWYRFWPMLALSSAATTRGLGGQVFPSHLGPYAQAPAPMVSTSNGLIWDLAIDATTIAAANPAARLLTLTLETGTGSTKGGGKSTLNDLFGRQTRDDGLGKRGGGVFGGGGK